MALLASDPGLFQQRNSIRQFLASKPDTKTFVVADLDNTLFDASERFAAAETPSQRDDLLTDIKFKDPVKLRIYHELRKYQDAQNAALCFLSGRCRSLVTSQRLALMFPEFYYIRNSKLINPTLSTKFLKVALLNSFFDEITETAFATQILTQSSVVSVAPDFDSRELIIFEDRDDITIALLEACMLRRWAVDHNCIDNVHQLILRF